MRSSSWFPDDEVTIKPVAGRASPPLWIRRIVVVEERRPETAVIREVTFRPGLNVVRIADRAPGEDQAIGHSVGKTMLVRFIRYCLGERYYASEAVLERIKRAFPRAYVLAEIELTGTAWVVSRPVGNTATGESYSIQSEDWHACLDDSESLQPFGNFQNALSEATVSSLPNLVLPEAGHSARWLDLLAWLARDQECSHRHYNEWRDPGANSQTGRLHLDDASLLLSWAMGFVDQEASETVFEHKSLLKNRKQATEDLRRHAARLDFAKESLCVRLSIDVEDRPDAFFVQKARQKTRETVESLQRLLAERDDGAAALLLQTEVLRITEGLGAVQNELDREKGLRQQAQGELKSAQDGSDVRFYFKFHDCPLGLDCPALPAGSTMPAENPRRAERILDLEEVISNHNERVERLELQLKEIGEERRQALSRYREASEARNAKLRGIQSQIERWNQLGDEVEEFESECQRTLILKSRCDCLADDIEESLKVQAAARKRKKKQRQWLRDLSGYFEWTLKGLFGSDARGEIRLDGRGLCPEPGLTLGFNGAAVSTLSTVLGFDLACLTATICGRGYAPPFFIHDSPREADMEDALYDRLFDLPLELERFYQGATPAFQYIVTTTSPPPKKVASSPYTRLILDARIPSGFLLGRRF